MVVRPEQEKQNPKGILGISSKIGDEMVASGLAGHLVCAIPILG